MSNLLNTTRNRETVKFPFADSLKNQQVERALKKIHLVLRHVNSLLSTFCTRIAYSYRMSIGDGYGAWKALVTYCKTANSLTEHAKRATWTSRRHVGPPS